MAKTQKNDISWEAQLTAAELEQKAALEASGEVVYGAPLEITDVHQLHDLGLTWKNCRTWRVGADRVKVHLTPSNQETHDFLLKELRAHHNKAHREKRCMIPGTRKPMIRCPESNHCTACPYPAIRDNYKPNTISWDRLIEDGCEESEADEHDLLEVKMELQAVMQEIDAVNPKFTQAIILKSSGYSAREIAEMMHDTERNVYYFIAEAKKIGAIFKSK